METHYVNSHMLCAPAKCGYCVRVLVIINNNNIAKQTGSISISCAHGRNGFGLMKYEFVLYQIKKETNAVN